MTTNPQTFIAMNDLTLTGSGANVTAAINWLMSPPTCYKDELLNPHVVDVTPGNAIVTYDSRTAPTFMTRLERECSVTVDLIGASELSDTIITYKNSLLIQTGLNQYIAAGGDDTLGLHRLYAQLQEGDV